MQRNTLEFKQITVPDMHGDGTGLRVEMRKDALWFSYADNVDAAWIDADGARQLKAFLEAFLRGEVTVPV